MSTVSDAYFPLTKEEKYSTNIYTFMYLPLIPAACIICYIRGAFKGAYGIWIALGILFSCCLFIVNLAVCSRRYRFDDEGVYVLWLGRFTEFHKWSDFAFTGIVTLNLARMRREKALVCSKGKLKRDKFGIVDVTWLYFRPFSSYFIMNTSERYDAFKANCPTGKFTVFL